MKRKIFTLSLTVFFISPAFCQDSLLNEELTGWKQSKNASVSIDTQVRKGTFSVRLEDGGNICRKIDLEPNTKYEISYFLKGKEITAESNQGVMLLLNAGKIWARFAPNPRNQPQTGTFEWTKGMGIIDTGKFDTEKISLCFMLKGKGTAWLSELKIRKIVDEVPESEGEIAFDNNLLGWNISAKGDVSVDSEVRKSDCSVRLGKDTQITRKLSLEPDTQYVLSCFMKGENISSDGKDGAKILLNSGKVWMRICSRPGNVPETGTFDWKEVTGIIDTGKFKSGDITLYLSLVGSGTVWFDKLQIHKK